MALEIHEHHVRECNGLAARDPLTGRLPGSRSAALEVQTRRFMAKGGANLDLDTTPAARPGASLEIVVGGPDKRPPASSSPGMADTPQGPAEPRQRQPKPDRFDHIKVLVRIRPALTAPSDRALAPSLTYGSRLAGDGQLAGSARLGDGREAEDASGKPAPIVRVTKGQTCFEGKFDGVLPPGTTQSRVFDEVRECIAHVVAGKNACVFAYGQTNSGKTYTMLGPPGAAAASLDECAGGVTEQAEFGIVPRALAQLLAARQETVESGEAMSIECCYLQVPPPPPPPPLPLLLLLLLLLTSRPLPLFHRAWAV